MDKAQTTEERGTDHPIGEALSAAQKRAVEALFHARDVTKEKVQKAASAVDEHVHENPWPYIGGAALVAFTVGFLLGRKK